MRRWFFPLCVFLWACGTPPGETAATTAATPAAPAPGVSADTALPSATDTVSHVSFNPPPPLKKPSGIYQFLLPYDTRTKILHTVAFYPHTYRLQEEYLNSGDSVVITEGTWAPSQGYIWLYKEQLARGRYTWQGDTLQFYSPRLKQKFSLTKLLPVADNPALQAKKKEGAVLFGVGTEPFWSVEVTRQDSIVLSVPDWPAPLRTKITAARRGRDSSVYTAAADSLQVTVFPYFCSDGMSDFTYPNKIVVQRKGLTLQGCGMLY